MADLEEMMDLLRQKLSPAQKRQVPVAATGPPLVGISMRQTRVTGPDVETIDRTVRALSFSYLLPMCTSEQGKVIGLVSVYTYMHIYMIITQVRMEYV